MDLHQRILCLAARTRLEAHDEARLLQLLSGPVDWEQLWAQGHLHEVLPLVATTLGRLKDQVAIPVEWMERAQRRVYATFVRNTTHAEELERVLAGLQEAGVEALPVKGIVLAELIYGNLALRPATDLDVLVRPSDLPGARAALRALGFGHRDRPSFTALHHPYHDPQYYRQIGSSEVCLELHWALAAPPFFHLQHESLWERAVAVHVRGIPARTLSPEDTLLHLAIHRSRSPLRLRFICDIAELLRRHSATLDWSDVLRQARGSGGRTSLFFGLKLAQQLLGAPLPPGVLADLAISRLRQQLLERVCGATALFRPAAPGDVSQQPHLTLRVLELDTPRSIARALGYTLVRTGRKHLYGLYEPLLRRSR